MPWWVWIALGVFGASMLAAGAVALARTLLFFQGMRSFSRSVEPLAARLAASAETLDKRNATLAIGQEHARQSLQQLRGSILQLRVLVAALEEIRLVLRLLRFVRSLR
jgi:hypothetical protein